MKNITQIIFLGLMSIFLLILIFTIVYFIKEVKVIKTDTLLYGMEKHNFVSCACYDKNGYLWTSTENGFQNTESANKYLANITIPDLYGTK